MSALGKLANDKVINLKLYCTVNEMLHYVSDCLIPRSITLFFFFFDYLNPHNFYFSGPILKI